MKIKTTLIAALLFGGISALVSCGGSQESSSAENEQESTQASTAATAETTSTEVVDPEAKSDSKGIGKFTSVELGAIDNSMAEKGEAVFTAKCSACHKPTDEKVVGPGLKNVTKRREPEWIMNMITNPAEMTQKDPVAKALFEKHLVQMTFQNVTDEETRQILEFFRKNDN